MLDIKVIRQDPERVKAAMKSRNKDMDKEIDEILETQAAFSASLGTLGGAFVAICMLFFAFSTIIGWYFFGEQNVKALFGHKAVKAYAAIVVVCIVIGSALHVDLVWNLSDLFNGLMVFPNLIALLALSGLVAKAAHDKDIMK